MTTQSKRPSKAAAKPKPSTAELRAALEGFRKEILVEIPEAAIQGHLADVERTLLEYVKASEIKGEWGVYRRSKRVGSRPYSYSTPAWFIIGYRDYTDDELAKEGTRLLAAKKRREDKAHKDRAAAVAKYNAAAAKLGLDPIDVPR